MPLLASSVFRLLILCCLLQDSIGSLSTSHRPIRSRPCSRILVTRQVIVRTFFLPFSVIEFIRCTSNESPGPCHSGRGELQCSIGLSGSTQSILNSVAKQGSLPLACPLFANAERICKQVGTSSHSNQTCRRLHERIHLHSLCGTALHLAGC